MVLHYLQTVIITGKNILKYKKDTWKMYSSWLTIQLNVATLNQK